MSAQPATDIRAATSTPPTLTRDTILAALQAWAEQRPGLDPANYFSSGDWAANKRLWDSERRGIYRDLQDARILLSAVRWRTSIDVAELTDAFRAYSGRLSLSVEGERVRLDYCTGQYWPTEYRKAACAVLAAALWAYQRNNMPQGSYQGVTEGVMLYSNNAGAGFVSAGAWLRQYFRREFGARIARRWFS